jgi:SRSO17 transposase
VFGLVRGVGVGFLAWIADAVRPPRQGLLLVRDIKPAAVAAVGSVVDPRVLTTELEAVTAMISDRFARPEAAQHAVDLVAGLISDLERKNCWTIAERAGHPSPHAFQHLLARAVCDTDGVRDDLRCYVTERLMTPGEKAVLVVDETGDLKKGTRTVGVQRQYTGTAGRVENAQVAVYLSLVCERGHTFIDRSLYLPRCWTDDTDRCEQAGVPETIEFATKPALAADMITRAVTGGVPVGWVTGDEVYGACPNLRATIRGHGLGYVLAVASNHRLTYPGADEADLAADLARTSLPWKRLSAGAGAKGLRYYSWARTPIEPEPGSTGHHGC